MKTKLVTLSALCILATSLLAGADVFVGTWKFSSARSLFPPDVPRFIVATVKIESIGNRLKSTASAADGHGIASDFTFDCLLDGTPCKIVPSTPMRGSSAIDTISLKRVDDYTISATASNRGAIVYSDRRVVSKDGKTMTVSRRGTTPEGKKYHSTIVLSRSR